MQLEQIMEGIVVAISYDDATCSVSPITADTNAIISNIKLPYLCSAGNAGVFLGISVGSRVMLAFSASRSRESAVILATIPRVEQIAKNFENSTATDIKSGTLPYPDMVAGRTIIRGESGNDIICFENGDIVSSIIGGSGFYLRRNKLQGSAYLIAEDMHFFSQAGRVIAGSVNRMNSLTRNIMPAQSVSEVPLFADTYYPNLAESVGFFSGSRVLTQSYSTRKRNPELAEYRHVINEFSTDSMFTGFDDELLRVRGQLSLYKDVSLAREKDQSNALHLAPHELIEFIGGNLVDLTGNPLDINYKKLFYGGPGNTTPTNNLELEYERAKKISRRGVGAHFQLSTNTSKKDESKYENNLQVDIDKEGVIKIHIPKSSNSGNILYPILADFKTVDGVVAVEAAFPSKAEKIPVTLRDENGEVVFPKVTTTTTRDTGIRFANDVKSSGLPTNTEGSSQARINPTKFHNMYAAGERLFANTIVHINIPQEFVNDYGMVGGNPFGKAFEVPIPDKFTEAESEPSTATALGVDLTDLTGQSLADILATIIADSGSDGFPSFMSALGVQPSAPAMYSGGATVVGGNIYDDDSLSPPFSNLFELSSEGSTISSKNVDASGNSAMDPGGKSINFVLDGALELSIGADNYDQKSVLLDTQGSVIAWLGKDRSGRSLVTQTDGEICINIGGSYSSQDSNNPTMNKGKLVLRVNVTDKGFVDSQFDDTNNPNGRSDMLIEMSEAGIIIAGMVPDMPMLIRNDGKILIESTGDLVLKGNQVKIVEAKGKSKTLKSQGR